MCPVRTCPRIVNTCNVVHAPDNKERGIGRPGKVVYLGPGGPAHVLCSPGLLILQTIGTETRRKVVLGGHPQYHVPVVSRRRKKLT